MLVFFEVCGFHELLEVDEDVVLDGSQTSSPLSAYIFLVELILPGRASLCPMDNV